MPDHHPGRGGKPILSLFLKANEDVSDAILSRRDGGRKLDDGLGELITRKYDGRFSLEVTHEPTGPMGAIRRQLETASSGDGGTSLLSKEVDVVILSVQPDVVAGPSDPGTGRLDTVSIIEDLGAVVRWLKERGATVLIFNACTVDPGDEVTSYHGRDGDTLSVRAHRMDLLSLEASVEEGISIIDVDRILAEMGAAPRLNGPLDYDAIACEGIRDEVLRVLEDYGFFEERPLLMQVGQQGARR